MRSGARLAEVGIEWETARGAHGCGRWSCEIHEVAAGGLNDAGAWIPAAEMPVAVMGQQDRIAQPPGGAPGVGQGRVGVEPGADDQDRILGRGVPGAGVAVDAGGRPGCARGVDPAQRWSADAADGARRRTTPGQATAAWRAGLSAQTRATPCSWSSTRAWSEVAPAAMASST